MPSVIVEPARDDSELEALRAGMRRHTERHVPWETYDELTVVLRDESGSFLGAALGESGRGWLHISVTWVHEDFRGHGFGRQLLESIESEALKRGCEMAFLDTFSYQAKPFYERCGYGVFGVLEDYPVGHCRYFMCKRLRDA